MVKKYFVSLFNLSLFLNSCFAPREIGKDADNSLSGSEVKFEKLMNKSYAKDYINADIITYVQFEEANANKGEYFKTPDGHIAFQVIPIKNKSVESAKRNWGSAYHVFIPKEKGDKIFDYEKGDS